jgi:hypothetical protein
VFQDGFAPGKFGFALEKKSYDLSAVVLEAAKKA